MSYRELLRNREYRLLFSGQVLSQLGDAIYEIGIVWLVYQMSGSAAVLGVLALCQSVPFLVCGIVAGAYADRWDRRITMVCSDLVRGLAVLYLAVRYLLGGLSVWEVCAVAVVLTTARAFFHPSMRALFPQLLPREQLLLANSLSEGAKRICKVGGMMLGGLLVSTANGEVVLLINALSFFLSLGTVWLIRSRSHAKTSSAPKAPSSILRDIGAAAKEIAKTRSVLFAILLSSLGLTISAGMIKIGLPLLAGQVLHEQGDAYGVMMACFSLGMFLSAALMKRMPRLTVVKLVLLGWTLYGLMFAGLALAPPLGLVYVLVGVTGFAHFLTDIPVTTLVQQTMPMERMSACQSIWASASFGSESLSIAVTGLVLGPLLTVVGAFGAAGGLLVVLGCLPLIMIRKNGQSVLDRQSLTE
jgi:MFS transporter, DHA3 family, macrolide efflux protein